MLKKISLSLLVFSISTVVSANENWNLVSGKIENGTYLGIVPGSGDSCVVEKSNDAIKLKISGKEEVEEIFSSKAASTSLVEQNFDQISLNYNGNTQSGERTSLSLTRGQNAFTVSIYGSYLSNSQERSNEYEEVEFSNSCDVKVMDSGFNESLKGLQNFSF